MNKPAPSSQRDRILDTCTAQPAAAETFPFGEDVAVFKVGGKIFALVSLYNIPGTISLKIEPELMEMLTQHPAIRPGYHLNKKYWITIILDGTVPNQMAAELIEDSHGIVFSSLTRRTRAALGSPEQPARPPDQT